MAVQRFVGPRRGAEECNGGRFMAPLFSED
jgi:hypothetical protein